MVLFSFGLNVSLSTSFGQDNAFNVDDLVSFLLCGNLGLLVSLPFSFLVEGSSKYLDGPV